MNWNPWKEIKLLRSELNESETSVSRLILDLIDQDDENTALRDAMRAIIAEEKLTSNATVKRMARIARGVLK
jgi:hypothetical protein